jgi:cobalamin synthase
MCLHPTLRGLLESRCWCSLSSAGFALELEAHMLTDGGAAAVLALASLAAVLTDSGGGAAAAYAVFSLSVVLAHARATHLILCKGAEGDCAGNFCSLETFASAVVLPAEHQGQWALSPCSK